jgi:2'-5' RNA ligase
LRAFIAIEIPEKIRKAVYELSEVIPPDCAKIRWVRPQSIHLTLVFLGEIFDESLDRIKAGIATAAQSHSRFSMALRGSGTFPHIRRPRVIWVGVTPEAQKPITKLAFDLIDSLDFLKLEEKKRFSPHITFGRIKSIHDLDSLQQGIECLSLDSDHFPVSEITLFKSELKPSGAEYTSLAKFPLLHDPAQ